MAWSPTAKWDRKRRLRSSRPWARLPPGRCEKPADRTAWQRLSARRPVGLAARLISDPLLLSDPVRRQDAQLLSKFGPADGSGNNYLPKPTQSLSQCFSKYRRGL